jgi:hypothetical protein
MPLHDWTRVPSGLFHHFHQSWAIRITDALNAGRLPKGLAALVEQRASTREPDVLAIEARGRTPRSPSEGGVAVMDPPATSIVRRTNRQIYAGKANRITIRHHLGRIVAVIEIVSPGNKDSRSALRDFIEKSLEFLRAGIHLLVIDVFPPSPRDPFGIHKAIWDEILEERFEFPPGKDRTLVSYQAERESAAYIEPIGIGDRLPEMPVFLTRDLHAMVPLEPTYQATWDAQPEELRIAVETGVLPDSGDSES